jgi:branched-chain amino acid transport system permease protein
MTGQLILNSFELGAEIALLAIGFTLIFGILRIVNFWHGEAFMLGAVIVFYIVVSLGLSYIWGLLIAVLAVGLLGWGSDKLIFRRFHGNLVGGAVAGIAISLGLQNIMWYVFGPRPRSIPQVISGTTHIFGATISNERLLIIGVSFGVIILLAWVIGYTKLGKAMRAVQEDSEAAATMGISVNQICALTFGIATALAALAGGLVAPLFSINPAMGVEPLLFAFIVVVLGGLGSITGAFIASFIIGFQQSFTTAYWSGQFALAVSFGLAMLLLIFRPRGLLGHD